MLEKYYNWSGLLVEPSKKFHDDLFKNRSSTIDTRCVFSETGRKVTFNEVQEGELSTIDSFSNQDSHKKRRAKGIKYDVETITLEDLLDEYKCPKKIDYLSIDTEGSEFEILENFNFKKYSFDIISVEHNFLEPKRSLIKNLLEANGYERALPKISRWDDWYFYRH